MMNKFLGCLLAMIVAYSCEWPRSALVIQTDFGLKDGAVSAMKGVAYAIDPDLNIFDLTHEVPAYDVWTAGYRLYQAAPFWPKGTVFVSVVDPGVGTARKSIVLKTSSGQYFVTPDNGTLTLVGEGLGISAVREIDEKTNRRPGSDSSYTFHGRDLYVYTAARLASGKISFEKVGPLLSASIVKLNYQKPLLTENVIKGNIPVLDVQYGNVWTNINDSLFRRLHIQHGDTVAVKILFKDKLVYDGRSPYVSTFGAVPENTTLAYLNSLMNFSLAINMGSFADSFHVQSGENWNIEIRKGR